MTPTQFSIAKFLEREGWEYVMLNDSGKLVFTRHLLGAVWVIEVGEDR